MTLRVPKYRFHKGSGQALVQINGQRIYLGVHGTAESQEKYRRIVAEWLESRQTPPVSDGNGKRNGHPAISINEMLLAFWQFAETYYCKDGQPTKELECTKEAIWPLRQLYGLTPAADFGPQSLKAVRQHMIGEQGLCRNVVNRRIGRIKRVFKWAVAEERVPPSTFHGLQALSGLRFGRTEARETEPVKPVDDKHVDATLPFVTPHVRAMVQVQRLTGMRPDDVVSMRPCDIDQSGDVWIYERLDHKNRWRGHRRLIPIGPRAQAVLKPFMGRDPEAFLVQPEGIGGLAFGAPSGPLQEGTQDEGLSVRTAGQGGEKGSPSATKAQAGKAGPVRHPVLLAGSLLWLRQGQEGRRRNTPLASKSAEAY